MISPARVAAYDILRRLSDGRSDLPAAVAAVRDALKDERDRALATEIATGTVRWRATVDHLIAHYAKRSIAKLDSEVVDILRLSIYQLLHLTRVPASAVVDDAVDLTRRAGKKSASGFVNAVLRNVSRNRRALPLPARPDDPSNRAAAIEYLSLTLSHPRWLAERWFDRVGFERAEAWMLFNNEPAALTIRANPLRTTRAELLVRLAEVGVVAHAARFAPDGIVIDKGNLREEAPRGEFVMQDEASQLVALLAGTEPGPLVLDACASPGGKATAIAMTLGVGERLIACDVRERRMALLQRTIAASGALNVLPVQADLTKPLPFRADFSTVIVDAPCSGLGTLRRDPDIRWRRGADDLPALAAAQRAMMANAAGMVRPGGRLVYATCSSEPEENEDVAAAFLASTPEFRAVPATDAHPALPADLVDNRGHLRTEPDQHGLELFFGAVFERAGQLCTLLPSMAFRTRVWSAGKLLLLVGALIATYVLFAAAGMRVALKAREVQVPDLVNRTANEATAVAGEVGLAVKLDDARRADPKVPAGRVLAQDPPPGTISREQRSIRVWLSTGPRAAIVPELTGQTERTAQMRLTQDGLDAATVSEIRSASFGSDVIVAQDPPPNTPGAQVSLLVNRAEQSTNFVMPDLIGVNGERAATLLRGRGFRVAVVASSPYPGVAAGIVLRQSPQAGFQIAPGEPISIEVSR